MKKKVKFYHFGCMSIANLFLAQMWSNFALTATASSSEFNKYEQTSITRYTENTSLTLYFQTADGISPSLQPPILTILMMRISGTLSKSCPILNASKTIQEPIKPKPVLGSSRQKRSLFSRTQRIFSGILIDVLIPASEESLERLMTTIAQEDLKHCDLIIIHDKSFQGSTVLQMLLRLPHFKQVASIHELVAMQELDWKSPLCQGTLILVSDPELLNAFGDEALKSWAYKARVVVAGLSKDQIELWIKTRKARKTEHILGVVKGNREGHYDIYANEVYFGKGLTRVATWRGKGFTGTPDYFPDKISNLHQAVLNVITFEFPPSIIYHRDRSGNLLFRYGWDVSIVEALARVFNFTIVFKEPPPGELWGDRLPNGTWNGMVGLLARGEGDLGIANIYVTALLGRKDHQDFSTPYAGDKSCYLARMEPPLPHWQSLALPFQMNTWIASLAGLVILGPLLCLIAIASGKCESERRSFQSLAYSILYVIGNLFRQPSEVSPLRSSTQIYVVFLGLYTMILTIAYSSNLTAFLTVSRQPVSMETFKELYESGRKVFGLGPFFQDSMAHSRNTYLRALAERFVPLPTYDDIKPRVLEGDGVMIQSRGYLEYASVQLTTQGRPKVRIMKECFAPFSVALAYQSDSPLKEKFDRAITWMFEAGLIEKWFKDSISLSQQYKKQDHHNNDNQDEGVVERDEGGVIPLGIDHLQGIFILLAFGCFISILVFVLELLLK